MKKQIKSFGLEVKEVNDKTGEVTFQFAAWNKDLDGEIIEKSAYSKTLAENKNNVYHNRDHSEAVGKPVNFFVEDKGAYCVSQLALKTINGNDCYEQYKAGIIKGHSQEFVTTKEDYSKEYKARVIKELRLWGVTSVTNIPANLDTPTLSIKSFEDAAKQMERINNLLHNGNASDELCEKFVTEYKKLNEFVTKHAGLKALGIIHCDSCKALLADMKAEGMGYGKCPGCGKFVNSSTGAMKSHSIITDSLIQNFKL